MNRLNLIQKICFLLLIFIHASPTSTSTTMTNDQPFRCCCCRRHRHFPLPLPAIYSSFAKLWCENTRKLDGTRNSILSLMGWGKFHLLILHPYLPQKSREMAKLFCMQWVTAKNRLNFRPRKFRIFFARI
jgi:hypothetical protein